MSIKAMCWVFEQDIRPAGKKLCLLALADHADARGRCFPSYRTLAKKTSTSRATVIRQVAELVKSGILIKEQDTRSNGSDTSNVYYLPAGDYECDRGSQNETGGLNGRGGVSGCDRGGSQNETPINPQNEPSINHIKPPYPLARGKRVIPVDQLIGFDEFYRPYPKHVSPGDAERAWAAIAPNEELRQQIAQGAVAYADECKKRRTEPRYIQGPGVWLRAKGWENEYQESPIAEGVMEWTDQ